jgi:hypothetical protein
MIQGFPQTLVDTGDHFDVDSQISTQLVGWLKPIKPLQDDNLPSQTTETFARTTELAFHIAAPGVPTLKGPTQNTRAPPQKVGRTTKNGVSSSNHAPLLSTHSLRNALMTLNKNLRK